MRLPTNPFHLWDVVGIRDIVVKQCYSEKNHALFTLLPLAKLDISNLGQNTLGSFLYDIFLINNSYLKPPIHAQEILHHKYEVNFIAMGVEKVI